MAMQNEQGALTLINDLVDDLLGEETLAARKANTVVAGVGGFITLLGTAAAYLVESETTLPSWFPMVITILGILGTIFKTNRTPNGITPSVAIKLQDKLTERIDLTHLHELSTNPPQVQQYQQPAGYNEPATEQLFPTDHALNLRNAAESIVNNMLDRR